MLVAAYFPGWEPTLPTLGQLFARGWALSTATRRRRFLLLPAYLQACIFGVALLFPGEAHAAVGTISPLMYVLGVTDSYGVPLSRYTLSTDFGTIFDGGSQAVLATVLVAEAALFVVIGGVAIWFLMYVISFGFLPDLVQPFAAVAQDYASAIIPGVAAIAAVVAATFIAFNILRGNTPRAASQAAAALVVAVIGGAMVSSPITWVISADGPLAQGRDVAVSLGSNSVAGTANTADTLTQLEGTLATSFVRRPLQTWNFGGQPDDTPACAAAWSSGVSSGNPDNIKDGIRDCGAADSAAMKATADNPGPGQLGTGVALLVFIGVFALFCMVLSFHIVMEFFRAVANAFKLLWGCAIGVIPGGPQASLVNTFVAMLFSFVAMFAYITMTIFVGEIVTVIFHQQGNGIVAMLSALVLMVVAINMIFKVSKGLKNTSGQVAAGVLDSVGAAPAAPTPNIFEDKAGGFLRSTGAVALGVGATLAGGSLAKNAPATAHALESVAPHLRGGGRAAMVLRNIDRGARRYTDDRRDEIADRTAEQVEAISQALAPAGVPVDDGPPAQHADPDDPTPTPVPVGSTPPPPAKGGGAAPATAASPPPTMPMTSVNDTSPASVSPSAPSLPPVQMQTPNHPDSSSPDLPAGHADTAPRPSRQAAPPRTGSSSALTDLPAPTPSSPSPRPPTPPGVPPLSWANDTSPTGAAPPSPFEAPPGPAPSGPPPRRGPTTGHTRPLPPTPPSTRTNDTSPDAGDG